MRKSSGGLLPAIVLASLGYFVDIYDLLLFSIVRVESLRDLRLDELGIKKEGEFIISIQMLGLLVGGFLWGILADKKGRLKVLFSSIILYSVANIFNGMVQTSNQYALVRFIAGVGLAGELGAGITLVSELASKEKRGLNTSLVAGVGLLGAVFAFFISEMFHWRVCYYIGGGLGIALLLLRLRVMESGMYTQVRNAGKHNGNIALFFTNANRFKKYLLSVLIGLSTWFTIGVLITFSNNFAKELGIAEPVQPKRSTMFAYAAIAIGDVLSGLISQWFRSRKKTLYFFYALNIIAFVLFFTAQNGTAARMYFFCALLGFSTGYWAIFVTAAAEQFGTNIRATAATTVPNIVRGSLPLIIILFNQLQPAFTYLDAAFITGCIVLLVSIIAAWLLPETYHKNLDYTEQ